LINPYSPPEVLDSTVSERVAKSLRYLSIASFACGFVAFMAYYGYPAFMSPTWYFGILPALAFLACTFGLLALSGPWNPSSRREFSLVLVALGLAFPNASFGISATLDATTNYGTFWLSPRILMFLCASFACWGTSKSIHGVSRGRRLASIGYGLGVLQCMTSLNDILYTEWAA
jgi:hypothetical protein